MFDSLGKLVCPRVNDDQKIDVDEQKLIFEGFLFVKLLIFPIFLLPNCSTNVRYLRTTTNACG